MDTGGWRKQGLGTKLIIRGPAIVSGGCGFFHDAEKSDIVHGGFQTISVNIDGLNEESLAIMGLESDLQAGSFAGIEGFSRQ